jgi:CBS domain-containing protein
MQGETMKLNEVMTRSVETIKPDATLQQAAEKMKKLNVGSIPVHDGRQLVGILTDRDITVRAAAAGRAHTMKVADAMTPDVVCGYEDQSVQEAVRLMKDHQIRRLPVLNRNNELVGIVALADLAVDATDEETSGEVLKEISEPAKPRR